MKAMAEQRCKFAHILILEAGGITSVYANDGGIVNRLLTNCPDGVTNRGRPAFCG